MASSASLSSSACSVPGPSPGEGDPTVASTDTRSSAGARRRSSATPIRYSHISICSSPRSSSERSLSPGITASDHSKKRGHCSPSTPSSSQITCSGNGMDRASHDVDRLAGHDRVDQRPRLGRHPRLHQAHHGRLEAGLDQPPVAGVLRRVGVHHGGRGVVGRPDLVDQDAPRRAEVQRIGADGRHLGVGHDGPEAAPFPVDPGHGRGPPQLGIELEGIAARVQRRIGEAAGVGGHETGTIRRSGRWGADRPGPRAARSRPRVSPGRPRPTRPSRRRPGSTAHPQ